MEYINHFTLNTGNNCKSYPNEINKGFYFEFKPIVKKIIETGDICDYLENSYLQITLADTDQYVATLYSKYKDGFVPIIMTIATSNPEKRDTIIRDAMKFRDICQIKKTYLPPDAPLIIDIVFPSSILRMDLLRLTGDLSRCLAWAILDPGSIV